MTGRREGRVIVGVDDTPTGLRALRQAVAEARRRGAEFHAVRTYPPPWGDAPAGYETRADSERACTETMIRAFDDAMGGVPHDVPVRMVVGCGMPGRVLVELADREDDLLVVGASRRLPWLPRRRSTGGYCAERAGCPVLVVPPHRMARDLDRSWCRWRVRSLDLEELTAR
jgi:nucleotide-binding universal stress UspA family protein